jgi:hypothetical protein
MPAQVEFLGDEFQSGTPYLAKAKNGLGQTMTVMLFNETVAYFERDNSISHSDLEYFEQHFVRTRRFVPGESLTISV